MSAPAPTAFEDQLAAALEQRAAPVTADAGARAAIDRRIASRIRARRIRRVGVAAFAVAVLAGVLALAQGGHDDAGVVTGPGAPAVHIPQIGLPPGAGTTLLDAYTPSRKVEMTLLGGNELASGDHTLVYLGAHLTLTVTSAPSQEVIASMGPLEAVRQATVGGVPALATTIPQGLSAPAGVVVWHPTPEVVAVVTASISPMVEDPAGRTLELADGLIELDDTAWMGLLDPDGELAASPMLGVAVDQGHAEMSRLGQGSTMVVLDTVGFAPATFELVSTGAVPGVLDAVDDPNHVDVRGTSGLVGDAPGYLANAYGFTQSLSWVEDGRLYRLDFTDAATPHDAVEVAEKLTRLTSDQLHALLFPTTLRTDLVPMPRITPAVAPPSEGPVESTVLSVTPTTGR